MSFHQSRSQRTHGPEGRDDPDHYALLGVTELATPEQIRRAYRAAMKRSHPDRVGPEERASAEDHSKRLNLAYRVLTSPERRRAYDAARRASAVQDQIMNRYFGGLGAPGSGNDLYEQIREAARAEQRRQRQRHDLGATVNLLMVFGALLLGALVIVLLWGAISTLLDRGF